MLLTTRSQGVIRNTPKTHQMFAKQALLSTQTRPLNSFDILSFLNGELHVL